MILAPVDVAIPRGATQPLSSLATLGIFERSSSSRKPSSAPCQIVWPPTSTRSHSTAPASTIALILASSVGDVLMISMPFNLAKGSMKAAFSALERAPPQDVKVKDRPWASARRGSPPRPATAPAAADSKKVRLCIGYFLLFRTQRDHAGVVWSPGQGHLRARPKRTICDLACCEGLTAFQRDLVLAQLPEVDSFDDLRRKAVF